MLSFSVPGLKYSEASRSQNLEDTTSKCMEEEQGLLPCASPSPHPVCQYSPLGQQLDSRVGPFHTQTPVTLMIYIPGHLLKAEWLSCDSVDGPWQNDMNKYCTSQICLLQFIYVN